VALHLQADNVFPLADFLQANYNNCSEVDLERVDDGEDGADPDTDASRKRPREEVASVAAVLTFDSISSGVCSSGSAAHVDSDVMIALSTATQSISAVVERLAEVAERQAEAAERLAAMQLDQNQQQQQSAQPQHLNWPGQLSLQQHILGQQHWLYQQRQYYWQSQQQHPRQLHPCYWWI
jgi:hypothetical protein